MAITKILARKGRLDVGIRYVLNGDKTQEQILTAHLNCEPGRELRQMLETKSQYGKEAGVQYYHMIQSFRPGEVSPELALEIARTLVEEHLPGYQAVIGVHVDKEHIHAHIIFNSVNADTGEKYHSSPQSYYRQIRAISDRLCREHGLSVILEGQGARAVSYAEWLRQTRGQPTFRAMLEADLRDAIQDANDLGHFFLLMEHKGWEIKHGNRLGFRLRGQDRFMMPGRKKSLFTEEGIRAAIQGELSAIEQGLRPAIIPRPAYRPFRPHPKYKGFLALYVHYLYLLGKARQRQYPPRMTPQLRQAAAQAERYRQRFYFLRDNDIATPEDMAAFLTRTEDALAAGSSAPIRTAGQPLPSRTASYAPSGLPPHRLLRSSCLTSSGSIVYWILRSICGTSFWISRHIASFCRSWRIWRFTSASRWYTSAFSRRSCSLEQPQPSSRATASR